jgi:hypothetical protein
VTYFQETNVSPCAVCFHTVCRAEIQSKVQYRLDANTNIHHLDHLKVHTRS